MVVALPSFVGLVLQIRGDGALGQDTEAVAHDVVLGAQRHAGVVHHVAAVLKQGDTGDARGDSEPLQDAQDVGALGIAFLLEGVQTVSQGDRFRDGLEAGFIGGTDFSQRVSLVDGGIGSFLGSLHSSVGVILQLILDGGDDHIQVVLGVGLVVFLVEVSTVPGRLGLGLSRGFGLFGLGLGLFGLGLGSGCGSLFLLFLGGRCGGFSLGGFFRLGLLGCGLCASHNQAEHHDQCQQDR